MQLFLNSGTFTSLDAVTHWANRIALDPGVVEIEAAELVRLQPGVEPHYRMLLLARVTDAYAAAYRLRTNEAP